MDAREERLARNEVLFRELNETIEVVAQKQGTDAHVYEFVCECSNIDCTLPLPLTLEVYEDTRGAPDLFLVAPGHDLPEIEDIVREGEGFRVVRKRGAAAWLAARNNPRS
ncbi:MAG: hypothetical protein QOK22_2635 [Gaiellaceae bacterium]|nr:hypothetical protein [Gaiellaceae bacterium]